MNSKVTTSESVNSAAIEDAAANWLVRQKGGLSPAEHSQLSAWLADDERHRDAFEELESAWSTLSFPGQIGRASEAKQQLAARAVRRRRRRLAAAGAALLLVFAGIVGVRMGQVAFPSATAVASVTPRPNAQTLPDGSTVELNAGAEISVEYSTEVRAVRLLRGEAMFAVAKNPARPFVVSVGEVTVRAVGTAFVVRQGDAEVGVLVTEGKVAVERVGGADAAAVSAVEPILVAAGGRVEMPADVSRAPRIAPAALSAAEMAAALAWRGRRVEFTHTTLAEAVAVFNRQNAVQIVVAEAAVGRVAISGIFWADDPEGFVRLLESGFALHAARAGQTITLRAR